jgi:branched-chain amino acid transport system permease protein
VRERAKRLLVMGGWFWLPALTVAVALPLINSDTYFLGICVVFAIYASINLMWTLVIGTAGLLSFATLAIVGGSAYFAGYQAKVHDLSWPIMLVIATGAGAAAGLIVAAPAIRLRSVYFALLTLGLVQLADAYVEQNNTLGGAQGLAGVPGFISTEDFGTTKGATIGYYAGVALLGLSLSVFWAVDRRRLGLVLRTARDSEPIAGALGIDIVRVRLTVFVASSAVLGLVGGFYAAYYQNVSPGIFSFDTLLLLLAMMVIGGLSSARGVVLGTALLLFIDQRFLNAGPWRLIAVGIVMLLITLFAANGLVGIPSQLRTWWRTMALRQHRAPAKGATMPRGDAA